MTEFVTVDVQDAIATVLLDRPPVNLLNLPALRELAAAFAEIAGRDDIAAVIVYGGDKIFSAGDDIAELLELAPAQATAMVPDVERMLDGLARLPVPVAAAITGYGLGAGLELALGADRRIAGDNAKFALPQVHAGFIPRGGAARLIALLGSATVRDLLLTGRFVGADEAMALGLVDEVVAPDEVYRAALAWAGQFRGQSRLALAAGKAALAGAAGGSLIGGADQRERSWQWLGQQP